MHNWQNSDWSHWRLIGLVVIMQVVTFTTGMYSGHTFWPKTEPQSIQPNYITTESNQPTTTNLEGDKAVAPPDCPIKGNISGKSKIYHLQGGAFYERTQEEMCFQTESEAEAAGFIKSSR